MARYDEKIKAECIKKRLEGRTINSINLEYGLSNGTLHSWMKKYKEDPKNNIKIHESEALLKLKKENADLKKELDFVKKAASYFANQQDK